MAIQHRSRHCQVSDHVLLDVPGREAANCSGQPQEMPALPPANLLLSPLQLQLQRSPQTGHKPPAKQPCGQQSVPSDSHAWHQAASLSLELWPPSPESGKVLRGTQETAAACQAHFHEAQTRSARCLRDDPALGHWRVHGACRHGPRRRRWCKARLLCCVEWQRWRCNCFPDSRLRCQILEAARLFTSGRDRAPGERRACIPTRKLGHWWALSRKRLSTVAISWQDWHQATASGGGLRRWQRSRERLPGARRLRAAFRCASIFDYGSNATGQLQLQSLQFLQPTHARRCNIAFIGVRAAHGTRWWPGRRRCRSVLRIGRHWCSGG